MNTPAFKQLTVPRDDNPRQFINDREFRLGLICTDCDPQHVFIEHDFKHWQEMPGDMQEREGVEWAVEDFNAWHEHMRRMHGITQNIKFQVGGA